MAPLTLPRPLWLLAALVAVAAIVAAAPPPQVVIQARGPPEPYERGCVMQGGVCRYLSDCPEGQLTSMRGLCPTQRSAGVECCYARPKRMKPSHHKKQYPRKSTHDKYWANRRWHHQNQYKNHYKNQYKSQYRY